jgi:putative salt-induced outer membrane protein YdiY
MVRPGKHTPQNMKNKLILAGAALLVASAVSTLAQSAPTTTESPKWSTSGALGLTISEGNTENTLFNANLITSRKWDKNEIDLGLDGAYGEADGVRNTANAHAFGQYNRLLNERLYGLLRIDGLHDDISDVSYRATVSPGLGYYLMKTTNSFLRVEAGPGFVWERVGGVEDEYVTVRLAERYETQLNERVKLWQFVEWLPSVEDFEDGVINGEVGIDASLTKKISLRAIVQDTYDSTPAPGLKHNDLKFIMQLAYKFS